METGETIQKYAGIEQSEIFYSEILKKGLIHYCFTTKSGSFFSTVTQTLAIARKRRDKWLKNLRINP